ncbi:HdeD family acid-resistance protein [Mucilaginibacter xinganensis]|uniref:HdeD family acid-resistance protein n=1 Tax=Mucilaginibacter xinganensis TaxID=1234841 RepID=A0A223NZM1_9SPHI|nr:DUF308 domain-containing protein [Mucilaginibacter xinganensis]ASU35327.1 hypothetical protein MuYL_3442 [Mucilaginibacter xinganensis]
MNSPAFKNANGVVNNWWLMLLAGIALIALGIGTIASPLHAYLSLSLVFAIGILAAGIFEIIFSLSNTAMIGWGWAILGGIVDLLIGGYLIAFPVITMVLFPLLVGFWILIRGFMAARSAFEIKAFGLPGWGWLLLTGLVIILLGIMILLNPVWGIVNIIIWTGLAFIVGGAFRIYLAVKLSRLK